MHFPVYFSVFGHRLSAHSVFEALAYFIGARVYFATSKRGLIPADKALAILVGAGLGAAIGSKLLSYAEDPIMMAKHGYQVIFSSGGKTIVGGLLGGLIGVELAKRRVGWKGSTGDDFVLPLTIGMCLGRVGCFLGGLEDGTYGTRTNFPTGVDFGDGVRRHPTQLYEIVFLLLLFGVLVALPRVVAWRLQLTRKTLPEQATPTQACGIDVFPPGSRFQMFMVAYLTFRFFIEFIKPTPHPYLGLDNIQMAAMFGVTYYMPRMRSWFSQIHATKVAPEAGHA